MGPMTHEFGRVGESIVRLEVCDQVLGLQSVGHGAVRAEESGARVGRAAPFELRPCPPNISTEETDLAHPPRPSASEARYS